MGSVDTERSRRRQEASGLGHELGCRRKCAISRDDSLPYKEPHQNKYCYIISDWLLCVFELQKPWGESSRKLTLNNQDPRIIPGVY